MEKNHNLSLSAIDTVEIIDFLMSNKPNQTAINVDEQKIMLIKQKLRLKIYIEADRMAMNIINNNLMNKPHSNFLTFGIQIPRPSPSVSDLTPLTRL